MIPTERRLDQETSSVVKRCALALLTATALLGAGCVHTQLSEPRTYLISEAPDGASSSCGDHCADEQIACFDRCWNSRPPLTSIRKGSEKHHEYCTTKCLDEYMRCVKEQEQREQSDQRMELHFPSMDAALSWLRGHKTEIAVGTIVVVAGGTFVIATGGSGALILAPLL
jgi:hypothetical protein